MCPDQKILRFVDSYPYSILSVSVSGSLRLRSHSERFPCVCAGECVCDIQCWTQLSLCGGRGR